MRTTQTLRAAGRLAIGVAAVAVAAAGLAVGTVPAAAAPTTSASPQVNPYSPAYQHPYRHGVVPTREVQAQMKAHPVTALAANDLNYGGTVDGIGVTTGAPRVYLVFWGSQWGTAGTDGNGNTTFTGDANGAAPRLQQLFKGLGNGGELWSGVMTYYCEGVSTGSQTCPATGVPHVGYPTGGALAGVWANTGSASPSAPTALQLGQTAVSAASHFGNTTASSNRNAQYVILSAHNVRPDGFPSAGFCAWHDWNGDVGAGSSVGDIAFTNMPYVLDAGTSCGQNFINGGSAGTLDGFTIVEGHEYSETITDQNPAGGWTDSSGEENADKCAWLTSGAGASQNVAFTTGTFAMQGTWGNDTNGCQISHSIVGGGGGGVTANNPGNKSGTVGTAITSFTMTATGGTPPYTWTATGLPPGISISSGGTVSGTPTTAGTFGVTATARDSVGATGSTPFTFTISPAGGGCGSPGQKLANPGFESGSASWSATAGVIGQNGPSEPAHSGTWNAWMDGYGSTHTDTLSQSVTIPAGCSATLTFWLHIDSAETTTITQFDKLTVKLGSTTLATYSNLNKASGYSQKSVNVGSFAGQTATLLFTATEDSSLQTSFVVDDTAVTAS
jgi:serine protease